ncbi:MAG: glycosyl hydrolase [Acidobacteria bacterium]|nr:glycosyl hydrolase [Acidobacteriota bacterium]
MFRASSRFVVCVGAALLTSLALRSLDAGAARGARISQAAPASAVGLDPEMLKGFQWRSIGPARGGRSIAVSGVKGRPREAYFGAVGGGLWKTTDAGETWAPVTDGQIKSSSVGAVAVSESNPDVVFIGTGESCIRGNIMPGDGVYKSADAGKTWTHVGFADAQNISKIRIHPTNPNVVFVAAFGRYGAPNDERGLYKSTDGGKTWKRTLFRDNKTAAIDVAIDRKNPSVMFAALWEAYRIEYQMSSGGPGSGLFKSTDEGETWTEITRSTGLPQGPVGKISVSISGADPNRVFALIENENGGLFSSDNAGATWTLVNGERSIRQRAFYYTHVFADPNNKDTVYALNTSAFRSTDGGKTLAQVGNGTHGDHHDMWIDPDDSQHLVLGNDGGGAVSTNGARTWSDEDYPTGQFYHVITTRHVPYHVCGAQQDNSTMCVSSDTNLGGRGGGGGGGGRGGAVPPYAAGGGEPGYIAPDPRNPDVFYSGANNGTFLTRLDRRTGELREVGAYPRFFSGEPASALVERWQWTYPIIFSPVDSTVLYTSSQHVWKTTNGGQSWEKISPDLTRHDPKTLGESGGPITHDMNSPEVYATVFALGPGKTDVNVLWAGSDDGVVQVTRDGGKTWTNVTPTEMPDLGRVSQIDASAFDPGAAYVAVKKPLLNDFAPYIFRTHDFGKTWTKVVTGIPASDYVHVVREDRVRRGLLYAGTQHGFYISYNDGDRWESMSLNLPDTQVSDIWVEANDITIATHGRGFYILDSVGPLRQYGPAVTAASDFYLFTPGDAIRSAGGATITYLLKKPAEKLSLEILDAKGQVVRSIQGAAPAGERGRGGRGGGAGRGDAPAAGRAESARGQAGAAEAGPAGGEEGGRGGRGGPPTTSMAAGLNRFTWDVQYEGATTFPGMILWGATTNGPTALPGTYQVRLTVDGRAQTQPLIVKRHPFRAASDADLKEQFDLALQIRDKVSEANTAVIQIRRVRQQANDRLAKSSDARLKEATGWLTKNLSAVEEEIYQVRNRSNQDPLNFPIKINNRVASLLRVVLTGEGKPTANAYPIFKDVTAELKVQTDRLQQVLGKDLAALNVELKRLGLEPVSGK